MPSLSKKPKTKASRWSKVVAGLQAPKRGRSLVVETGFPTSLIDLFVKNRDRLKKKKRAQMGFDDQMKISRPSSLKQPAPLPLPEECVIEGETLRQANGEVIGGIKAVEMLKKEQQEKIVVEERKTTCLDDDGDDGVGKSVFVQVLKMFVVVVLGLSTRKLAVGITLSAFLLLFVEYVGRKFESPCVKSLFGRTNVVKDIVDSEGVVVMENESSGTDLGSKVEEIQVVGNDKGMSGNDRDHDRVQGVVIVEARSESSSGELMERCSIKELIEEDGAEVSKNKSKKKAKLIIKRIVNRLENVKKELKEKKKKKKKKEDKKAKKAEASSGESGELEGDFSSSKCELTEEGHDKEQQEQDDAKEDLSMSSEEQESTRGNKEQTEVVGEVLSSGELCKAEGELSAVEEKMEKARQRSSGYLILLVIVLAGLMKGRVLALAITIVWFMMLKLVRKIKGRCK